MLNCSLSFVSTWTTLADFFGSFWHSSPTLFNYIDKLVIYKEFWALVLIIIIITIIIIVIVIVIIIIIIIIVIFIIFYFSPSICCSFKINLIIYNNLSLAICLDRYVDLLLCFSLLRWLFTGYFSMFWLLFFLIQLLNLQACFLCLFNYILVIVLLNLLVLLEITI